MTSQLKTTGNNYKLMGDDIDRRYKIEFGTLDVKGKKDDPMGLHQLGEGAQDGEGAGGAGGESDEKWKNNDLDAFNKGKGKGKNDGKCNTCGGDGHYMRDCPTTRHLVHRSAMDAMAKGITKPSVRRPTLN